MIQATHTPGPWTALDRGYKSHVTDADMNWGAEIIGPGHAANARLIAAAPELLAVLEQCLPIIDAHRRAALGEGDIAAMNARAAIAKAKGE